MSINASASEIVNKLLVGMSLDSIRIYSVVLVLEFFRPKCPPHLPNSVSITISGKLDVDMSGKDVVALIRPDDSSDFFNKRALSIAQIYLMMGTDVGFAQVVESGELEIMLGENRLKIGSDGEDMEEVWTLTNNPIQAGEAPQWRVSLDDRGDVSLQTPLSDNCN